MNPVVQPIGRLVTERYSVRWDGNPVSLLLLERIPWWPATAAADTQTPPQPRSPPKPPTPCCDRERVLWILRTRIYCPYRWRLSGRLLLLHRTIIIIAYTATAVTVVRAYRVHCCCFGTYNVSNGVSVGDDSSACVNTIYVYVRACLYVYTLVRFFLLPRLSRAFFERSNRFTVYNVH